MLTNFIKGSLCLSKNINKSYSLPKKPLGSSLTQGKFSKTYATMSFNDVYVKHEYGREPDTIIKATLREKTSDLGDTNAKKMRKSGLIPASLNITGTDKQVLLYVKPSKIFAIMKRSDVRFLGYRYILKIEETGQQFDVIGSQMDVDTISYYPRTVTFNLYDPKKLPKMKLSRHAHDIHFQKLIEFPPIETQRQMKEEGTYKYRRYFKQKGDD